MRTMSLISGWAVMTVTGSQVGVAAAPMHAAAVDSMTVDTLAPGVIHRHLTIAEGPWSVHVVEVDLRHFALDIRAVHANDRLRGRETVSSMVHRHGDSVEVIAAVNADFFNLTDGEDENNQVVDGVVWKAMAVTDAPQDTAHRVHAQFGMTRTGAPVMGGFALDGTVSTLRGSTITLDAVNHWPDSNALVLYTRVYGEATAADSAGRHPEGVPVRVLRRHGDTLDVRVAGAAQDGGSVTLAAGAVLAASGAARMRLLRMATPGARLRVVTRLESSRGPLEMVVGGWPRLVVEGRSIADSVDRLEGTVPSFSVTRHPRTGIGFSRDSSTLYLITVDGRQESSSGMSLAEFAALMLRLGVYQGLNLDGGGSTAMVLRGQLVNHPSDKEGERAVGNAILVVRHG
jgi:hypothetical protein